MTTLQPKDTALLFKVTHSKPIEMRDFVATMTSLASLFEGYAKCNADSSEGRKAKLYVEKIEQGSLAVYLQEVITSCALPLMEDFNTVLGFTGYLAALVRGAIQGKNETRLTIPELKALFDLFAINAADAKATTEFGAVARNDVSAVYNHCTFNFYESNTAQNQIKRTINQKELETPVETIHERQLMTIFQMRGDMTTNVGNKAVIDTLVNRPLPVVFESDELKRDILSNDANPTKHAYLVDVVIMTVNNKPTAYKIMALHDIIPLD